MQVYNKLVRDRIPEVIKSEGRNCVVRTLRDDDARKMLSEKILEEAGEFIQNPSMEEMADILEILYSLMKKHGWRPEDVERIRAEKSLKRGSFDKNVFLVEAD